MKRKPRQSLREILATNQAQLDFMSKLAGGTGHVNKVVLPPVRAREPRDPCKAAAPSEADTQKAILKFLRVHPAVGFAIRINSGGAVETHNGVERYITYNSQRGMSDIFGVMKGGRAFFIEVKSATGRLTQHQNDFIMMALNSGALAGVARSIDDVQNILGI